MQGLWHISRYYILSQKYHQIKILAYGEIKFGLEQDIEREIYREEKTKLVYEKKSLEEQTARIEQKQNDWLEPFQNWIKVATTLVKIARGSNLLEKKVAAKEIFGSNLRLASRAVRGEPVFPYLSALRAAESVGKKSESLILVPEVGLEPTRVIHPQHFKCCAYANSATRAYQ